MTNNDQTVQTEAVQPRPICPICIQPITDLDFRIGRAITTKEGAHHLNESMCLSAAIGRATLAEMSLTHRETKLAMLEAEMAALRAVPLEFCLITGDHDPTHSPRYFCNFQLRDYALKIAALLYGVDAENPTKEQLNRVPRAAGKHATGWMKLSPKTAAEVAEWLEVGVGLPAKQGEGSQPASA